ncbi:SIR2 family protein [Cetobacterium sp.]|uniref:SIR2 family protein n=1 Tax=Cetobacterium sp. TaxID=2071632 RepID=UPI003F2CFEBD
MRDKYIDFLAEELQNQKLVIFVGAGVSINSDLPSWHSLVKSYAEYMGIEKDNYNSEEMLEIPEKFYNHFGKIKYYDILEKKFKNNHEPNFIHKALNKLNLEYIITTNYDNLIEIELNESNEYDVVTKDEELAYSKSKKMIIKMHGDIENRNVVLKRSDYDKYEQNFPLITTFVKSLFTTNTVLFIGYSLNDVNVKNIMKWISDILNEDFRRVYLVDFESSDGNESNNNLINKILLQCSDENKGKKLADFLTELYSRKKKNEMKENFKIYENLNYITEDNLKKIIKDLSVCEYSCSSEGIITTKKIKLKKMDDPNKYRDIFFKARINNIVINKTEKIELNELFSNKHENNNINNIINSIMTFDKNKFVNSIQGIENSYLKAYGFTFFHEFQKAKDVIGEYKIQKLSKEKIIWNNFILLNIENEEQRINFKNKDKIDLNKIYRKFFKTETELYQEIFENLTLSKIENKIENYLYKIRKNKNCCNLGTTTIENSEYSIKEAFNHCILNGISLNNFEMYKIIKKYLEILFIAYTNEVQDINRNNFFGESSKFEKVDKIDYLDIFLMMQLNLKDLKLLFKDYFIDELKCDESCVENIIQSLKNVLNFPKELTTKVNEILTKILLLLSKTHLTEEQSNKCITIILNNTNFFKLLISNDISSHETSSNFINFLYTIIKNLKCNILKELILKIVDEKDLIEPSPNLINFLTYYFKEKTEEKIIESEDILCFLKSCKTHSQVRLYFTRILEKSLIKKIINEEKIKLNQKFEMRTYMLIIDLELIAPNFSQEKLIIEKLESLELKNDLVSEADFIINNIFYLLLNNLVTSEFIEYMKNYRDESVIKYIEKKGFQNILNYSLDKENFDYSLFKLCDFEIFTKNGLKELIKNSNNNKDLLCLLHNYIKSKNKNDLILETYLEYISEED